MTSWENGQLLKLAWPCPSSYLVYILTSIRHTMCCIPDINVKDIILVFEMSSVLLKWSSCSGSVQWVLVYACTQIVTFRFHSFGSYPRPVLSASLMDKRLPFQNPFVNSWYYNYHQLSKAQRKSCCHGVDWLRSRGNLLAFDVISSQPREIVGGAQARHG